MHIKTRGETNTLRADPKFRGHIDAKFVVKLKQISP